MNWTTWVAILAPAGLALSAGMLLIADPPGERFRLALLDYLRAWRDELPEDEQSERYAVAKREWDAMRAVPRLYWRYRLWRMFGPMKREVERLEREKAQRAPRVVMR